MDILIDFDGTCVTHAFPKVGEDIGAVPVLKKLTECGHNLILFTMRSDKDDVATNDPDIHPDSGKYLADAVNWFVENEIPLYGIQTNPTQHTWTSSPKAFGHMMIDDSALGCPLVYKLEVSARPFVDWVTVEKLLRDRGVINK